MRLLRPSAAIGKILSFNLRIINNLLIKWIMVSEQDSSSLEFSQRITEN